MCLHMIEHLRFHIPTQALADQTDRYQFTVATLRLWTRSSQMPFHLLALVVNDYIHS